MSQTAEELLDSLSEDDISMYTANPETEEHIVIGEDRIINIPQALKRIAVQHDHNVETVIFDCPRYWDDTDLSTLYIWINYIRSDKVMGRYLAKNKRVDENDSNMIHFDWTIGNEISEVDGPIVFLVCALKTNSEGMEEVHWNSEKCTDCFVSEGMECADSTMNEYPDIITDLLTRMDSIIAANSTILDTSLTQAGLAADARATGEAINKVDNRVTEIIEGTDYTEVVGNPIHLKEASRNNANLTPIGVTEQTVIEGEAGVSVVGESIHVTDVDPNKEASLFAGANTTQESREGYNLYNIGNIEETTRNGVTYSIKNGIFKANGTATGEFGISTKDILFDLESGDYTFGIKEVSGTFTGIVGKYVSQAGTNIIDGGQLRNVINVTLSENYIDLYAYLWVNSGTVFNNYEVGIVLVKGTYTASTLPPYEQFGAMPSIDFPSEIKSVGSGSTNKFDISKITESHFLNHVNGNLASSTVTNVSDYIPVKANHTYTFKFDFTSLLNINVRGICYFDNTKTYLSGYEYDPSKKSITVTPTQDGYIRLSYDMNCTDIMFYEGTEDLDYLPYGVSSYTFEVVNKNIFDGEIQLGTLVDGRTLQNNTLYVSTNFNKVKPNTDYIFSVNSKENRVVVNFYTKEKVWIDSENSGQGSILFDGKFTTPKDCYYIKFRCYAADFDLFATGKIQIEEGTTVTSNVESQSQSLNLDFPEGIELNKLGDSSDKIDFTYTMDETGYKTIDRDSVNHVGNTYRERIKNALITAVASNVGTNKRRFYKGLSKISLASDTTTNKTNLSYMNRYKLIGSGLTYHGIIGFAIGTESSVYMYDEKYNDISDYNDSQDELLAAYNAFLDENETYIVYPLATPISTPITDETFISQLEALINIKPYEGVTNVFVTSSDDGSCLPLTEFLYNYITAAPSVKRPTSVLGMSGDSKMYHTGKNMFTSELESGSITATGSVYVDSKVVRTKDFIKVCPNVSYSISRTISTSYMSFRFYDKDYNYIGNQLDNNVETNVSENRMAAKVSNMTMTIINPNVAYMKITDHSGDLTSKYQIEVGPFASDYSEPQNETIKLTLPEGMELFEGESIYKEEGKWYRDKDYHREEITEDYTIYLASSSEGIYQFEFQPKYTPEYNNNDSTIRTRSNLFLGVRWHNSWTIDNAVVPKSDGRIRFMSSKYTTVDEFKAFITKQIELNDPLYVVYKLANPGPEEITDATLLDQLNELDKLKTYKGVNNFFLTSAGADGLMKLEYRKFNLVGHEDVEGLYDAIDKIPTKTSELNNDSNFVDQEDLNKKQDTLKPGKNITISDDGTISVSIPEFITEAVTFSVSTTGVTEYSTTKDVVKDGYLPIGIVGDKTTNDDILFVYRYLSNVVNGSCKINLRYSGHKSDTISGTLTIYILWVKV